MRCWIKRTVWSLSLVLLFGGTALAKKAPAVKEATSCGDYGTQVRFEESPAEAAKFAKKEGKLVMVLHISGHFDDPALT